MKYLKRNDIAITVEDIKELVLAGRPPDQLPVTTDGVSIEDKLDAILGWVYRWNPTVMVTAEPGESREISAA